MTYIKGKIKEKTDYERIRFIYQSFGKIRALLNYNMQISLSVGNYYASIAVCILFFILHWISSGRKYLTVKTHPR